VDVGVDVGSADGFSDGSITDSVGSMERTGEGAEVLVLDSGCREVNWEEC